MASRDAAPGPPISGRGGGYVNSFGISKGLGAGGAPRAPDELETREAEASMRNSRGEADLGAQRRDHEGPRVEHGGAPSERH